MLIRHDLRLVFLHVPKCAGKEIRDVLKTGAKQDTCIDRFNFEYSDILHRHVDLAHLALDDLAHYSDFKYLKGYTVIAAVRNPYQRIRSAANEYYRQFSSSDEASLGRNGLTTSMLVTYDRQIPYRHAQRDPRFVHSLPLTWFTHLGGKPMVDHILRCETLLADFLHVANLLGLPSEIMNEGSRKLRDCPEDVSTSSHGLNEDLTLMANLLYGQDFSTFGYEMRQATINNASCLKNSISLLEPQYTHSHSLDLINTAQRVEWHWGPSSQQRPASSLEPTRQG